MLGSERELELGHVLAVAAGPLDPRETELASVFGGLLKSSAVVSAAADAIALRMISAVAFRIAAALITSAAGVRQERHHHASFA
jgi:hypothetical protein